MSGSRAEMPGIKSTRPVQEPSDPCWESSRRADALVSATVWESTRGVDKGVDKGVDEIMKVAWRRAGTGELRQVRGGTSQASTADDELGLGASSSSSGAMLSRATIERVRTLEASRRVGISSQMPLRGRDPVMDSTDRDDEPVPVRRAVPSPVCLACSAGRLAVDGEQDGDVPAGRVRVWTGAELDAR
jgi:hypothetical protein